MDTLARLGYKPTRILSLVRISSDENTIRSNAPCLYEWNNREKASRQVREYGTLGNDKKISQVGRAWAIGENLFRLATSLHMHQSNAVITCFVKNGSAFRNI